MAWWNWSKTAANNATADPSINWAEGQSPSSVNDSARALMARAAEFRDDTSGLLTTAGTSTNFTVTTNQGLPATPSDGQLLTITPHVTNAFSCALAADGGTAFPIRQEAGTALPAGTLVAGSPYMMRFSVSGSVWLLHNVFGSPYTIPLGGIVIHTGDTSPNSNFVFANGAAISRTTYAEYFALVGTRFGAGDGVTTFNVPDLRERTIAFQGTMGGVASPSRITTAGGGVDGLTVGASGGAQNRTIAQGNLPNYTLPNTLGTTNTLSWPTRTYAITGGAGAPQTVDDPTSGTPNLNVGLSGSVTITGSVTSGGSGTALQTLPPVLILTALVRIF